TTVESIPPSPGTMSDRADEGAANLRAAPTPRPRLRDLALAAIAGVTERAEASSPSPESAYLKKRAETVSRSGTSWPCAVARAIPQPAPGDEGLAHLALEFGLNEIETLVVALATAVENDTMAGRVLAHVQTPVGGSRPTLGLIATAFAPIADDPSSLIPSLA